MWDDNISISERQINNLKRTDSTALPLPTIKQETDEHSTESERSLATNVDYIKITIK